MRLPVLASIFVILSGAAAGQTPKAAPRKATPPRTEWGAPDLRGVWDFSTLTPMERPQQLAGKEVLSEGEVAAFEKQALEAIDLDRRDGGPLIDRERAYNRFWWDYGTKVVGTRRTSLIVDPPDGKIPPLAPEGQKRASGPRQRPVRERLLIGAAPDGPEDMGLSERCILGFNAGPPLVPTAAYNNNVQIFQTPLHVALLNEMIHDARIVPLDGRPHLPSAMRQWLGDARGRWQGDTLVVESTNFTDQTGFSGSVLGRGGAGENLRLVERFTRLDADTLRYEFTVEDPTIWTRPWSASIPMKKTEGPIFEYACHEGNYSMFNILTGVRAAERAAEQAARKGAK